MTNKIDNQHRSEATDQRHDEASNGFEEALDRSSNAARSGDAIGRARDQVLRASVRRVGPKQSNKKGRQGKALPRTSRPTNRASTAGRDDAVRGRGGWGRQARQEESFEDMHELPQVSLGQPGGSSPVFQPPVVCSGHLPPPGEVEGECATLDKSRSSKATANLDEALGSPAEASPENAIQQVPSGLQSTGNPGLTGVSEASAVAEPQAIDPTVLQEVARKVLEAVQVHLSVHRPRVDLSLDLGALGLAKAQVLKESRVDGQESLRVLFVVEQASAEAALDVRLPELASRLRERGLEVRDLRVERPEEAATADGSGSATGESRDQSEERRSRGLWQLEGVDDFSSRGTPTPKKN